MVFRYGKSQRALADLLPKLTQPVDAPLRRVARYDRRVDGADRNSRDPVWMEIGFRKSLVDPGLIGAERASALQQQGDLLKL